MVAERGSQAAHGNDRLDGHALFGEQPILCGVVHQMPTELKMTAYTASSRITPVIDVTTDVVVPRPRLSVLGWMRRPKWQAISAIRMPKVTPFNMPIQ